MEARQFDRITSQRSLILDMDGGRRLSGQVKDVSLNGLFLQIGEEDLPTEGTRGSFKMEGGDWKAPSKIWFPRIKFKVVRVLPHGLGIELVDNQGYFAVAMASVEFMDYFEDPDSEEADEAPP